MEQNTVSSYENKLSAEDVSPLSVFSMQFSAMEMEHMLLHHAKPIISKFKRVAVLVSLLFLISAIPLYFVSETVAACLFSSAFLAVVYFIVAISAIKKNAKKNALESEQTKDDYEIFEDHIKITVYESNVLKSIRYITYEEIDDYNEEDGYFYFVKKNLLYLFRKNDPACSMMIAKIKNNARCEVASKAKSENKKDFISTILILIVFVTTFAPLLLRNFLSHDILNASHIQLEFFFLPIPLGCLIASLILRQKVKFKQIILTSVMCAVLLILSAVAYGFLADVDEQFNDSDAVAAEAIELVEMSLGLDLPDNYEILYAYNQDANNYFSVSLEPDKETVAAFIETVKNSEKWLDYSPSILIGIKNYNNSAEYSLVYNEQTKQYNALPDKDGTYTFLYLDFSEANNCLYIERYEYEYVAYTE